MTGRIVIFSPDTLIRDIQALPRKRHAFQLSSAISPAPAGKPMALRKIGASHMRAALRLARPLASSLKTPAAAVASRSFSETSHFVPDVTTKFGDPSFWEGKYSSEVSLLVGRVGAGAAAPSRDVSFVRFSPQVRRFRAYDATLLVCYRDSM